jgi:FecR protein
MKPATPFRLTRSTLLFALVSVAFAVEAGAAAGRVEFAFGGASVTGADGQTRPAARGSELDTGDVVRTTDGRVQIRMTDGSYISLQPNSEFGIKNYRFEGKTDGSESAIYSLVKGAMRTVTGLVGRVNRNRYQVGTPTATVGIRGTGGLIQILPDGSTLVQGTSGIWFLSNAAGSIDIPAGVSGLAPADPKRPPQETSLAPTAGPTPPLGLQGYVQGEQRTDTGENVLGVTPLPSGGGYAANVILSDFGNPVMAVGTDATATFDSAGQMTSISGLGFGQYFALGAGGTHADFGTDGILAWGRWIGPVTGDSCGDSCTLNENYNTNQGFHYVVGMPTTSMPQTGTATYTLLGATQPTYLDGTVSPGTFSGRLSVDFGQRTVGMDLNVAIDSKGYAIGGTAGISGSAFSSSTGNVTVGGTAGGACSSACSASVDGFFAGANAVRAGLGYHITDSGNGRNIIGAAAFAKQ